MVPDIQVIGSNWSFIYEWYDDDSLTLNVEFYIRVIWWWLIDTPCGALYASDMMMTHWHSMWSFIYEWYDDDSSTLHVELYIRVIWWWLIDTPCGALYTSGMMKTHWHSMRTTRRNYISQVTDWWTTRVRFLSADNTSTLTKCCYHGELCYY